MIFDFAEIQSRSSEAFPNKTCLFRPIIPFRIINKLCPEKHFEMEAVIDSGSDYTILPLRLGVSIGLSINEGKTESISPIGSAKDVAILFYEVILEIKGKQFCSYLSFADEDDIGFPVLGCIGFFDLFEVKMDYLSRKIELLPKVKSINP